MNKPTYALYAMLFAPSSAFEADFVTYKESATADLQAAIRDAGYEWETMINQGAWNAPNEVNLTEHHVLCCERWTYAHEEIPNPGRKAERIWVRNVSPELVLRTHENPRSAKPEPIELAGGWAILFVSDTFSYVG
jgi:hypothetical protein